jgi:signal transduction histidine kinase
MKAATKAAEIIRNMLQFSRKSESKRVKYPLAKLIDEVIELTYNDYDLKKKYDMRNIKIIKEFEDGLPDAPITVTEIQQVLFNLIQNAAHALKDENSTSKQPTLIFRLKRKSAFLSIEVEDNGPGIPEKIRKRVFEPFFTTKNVGEGTGLGLSVSYMIVKNNHNGNIFVNSQVGKGSVFFIELPLERGKHEENQNINS